MKFWEKEEENETGQHQLFLLSFFSWLVNWKNILAKFANNLTLPQITWKLFFCNERKNLNKVGLQASRRKTEETLGWTKKGWKQHITLIFFILFHMHTECFFAAEYLFSCTSDNTQLLFVLAQRILQLFMLDLISQTEIFFGGEWEGGKKSLRHTRVSNCNFFIFTTGKHFFMEKFL